MPATRLTGHKRQQDTFAQATIGDTDTFAGPEFLDRLKAPRSARLIAISRLEAASQSARVIQMPSTWLRS